MTLRGWQSHLPLFADVAVEIAEELLVLTDKAFFRTIRPVTEEMYLLQSVVQFLVRIADTQRIKRASERSGQDGLEAG